MTASAAVVEEVVRFSILVRAESHAAAALAAATKKVARHLAVVAIRSPQANDRAPEMPMLAA